MSMLDAAMLYASWGWPIFPCKANKAPYTLHGFKDATIDHETIQAWWQRWPGACIGLRCGAESGVWVVDIDNKDGKQGSIAWLLLQAMHGTIRTAHITTPTGGQHWYFRWTEAMNAKAVNKQVSTHSALDTRTEGGYVLLPPSQTPQGQYLEDSDDGFAQNIVEAPAWLMGLLEDKVPEKREPPSFSAPLPTLHANGLSPAEAFNVRFSWIEILEPYGWVCTQNSDTKATWKRPGKHKGAGATTTATCFYVFSSSTEFEARKGYSKFGAYAVLRHGGDRSAAARHLMQRNH